MKFRAEGVQPFLNNFDKVKTKIRAFDGCEHLQLWRDINDQNTFFTFSKWQSQDHLNNYRNSDLFKVVWKFTKALFDDKPAAWSVDQVEVLE